MSSETPNYDIVKELLEEFNVHNYTESKLSRIRALYCKGKSSDKRNEIVCTDDEFYQFMYFVLKFKLDPLQGYIQCIKYSDNVPAQIFLGKDALIASVTKLVTSLSRLFSLSSSQLFLLRSITAQSRSSLFSARSRSPVRLSSLSVTGEITKI